MGNGYSSFVEAPVGKVLMGRRYRTLTDTTLSVYSNGSLSLGKEKGDTRFEQSIPDQVELPPGVEFEIIDLYEESIYLGGGQIFCVKVKLLSDIPVVNTKMLRISSEAANATGALKSHDKSQSLLLLHGKEASLQFDEFAEIPVIWQIAETTSLLAREGIFDHCFLTLHEKKSQ